MNDKIKAFGDFHVPGDPLILYNIWDAGSAKAVTEAGAKAIATGSWGVACSMGFKDGETLPLDAALENLERILSVTDLPVTIDMEAGYGADPAAVGASVARAAAAGAVGINIEDKDPATRQLFETADAAGRIKAAAASGLWINARADLFISLHYNSVENGADRVTGVEVYSLAPQYQYSHSDPDREDSTVAIANLGNRQDHWNALLAYTLQYVPPVMP